MRRNSHNCAKGFIFIPLIFSIGGGLIGGAIGGGAIGGIGISAMFGLTGTQIGGMLGMMAGSTLANMLFPQEKPETAWPELNEYPLQKTTTGPPIQKVLGTAKVAGNFTWEGDVIPYTVKHSAGGKGGGASAGKGGEVEETRYQQSFLIDLGEGPASILRIWANNQQIWPALPGQTEPDVTIFEGIDNSGIKTLTSEDYGEWPRNCCVFFNAYDLGNYQTKPNFTFEMSSAKPSYFIGLDRGSGSKIIYKVKGNGSIDTSWATDGGWSYNAGFGSVEICYDLYQMSDGRLLVVHNPFWIEANNIADGGKEVICTMLAADGSIDTSWGYNGHYVQYATGIGYAMSYPIKILRAGNDNFHLVGVANFGSVYNYHIFDAEGTRLYAYAWNSRHPMTINDAVMTADQQRIVAVGNDYTFAGWTHNTVAFKTADGSVDTDWDGNVAGHPGYGHYATGTAQDAYAIRGLSDGAYLIHFQHTSTDDRTLAKIAGDGSGYVAEWGTAGLNQGGVGQYKKAGMAVGGNRIWTLGRKLTSGSANLKIQVLNAWDLTTGESVQSREFESASWNDVYHCMGLIAGNLLFGTLDLTPATNEFERWTQGIGFLDGFDITGGVADKIYVILPQAPARETLDMNFATMCREILTDDQWGAGFDASTRINETTFTGVEDYCGAQGFLGSIVLRDKRDWRDWLDYICAHFGGYWYEIAGQICLGVYKDETAVFDLTVAAGDFALDDGEHPPPPISVKDREYSETLNRILVTWTDRDKDYAQGGPTPANDETDQRVSGMIREKTWELAGITNGELAQRMAYQLLIEAMYRFKSYFFRVPYRHMLLEVGDVGTISDGDPIVNQKVRIFQISEEPNGRALQIVAVEDITGLYPSITFSAQTSLRSAQSAISLADGTIYFREDTVDYRMYLSIVPGSAQANGWYIYRSYDDSSYELIGRCGIDGVTGGDANSAGTIQGSLAAHETMTWQPGESVLVSIGTVTDLHTDITEGQFWNNQRLARIGDEIISFRDAEETATPGTWRISWLKRGLFGTEAAAHSPGASFCTLDANFIYKFSASEIGRTLYFKAVTFYGEDTQNTATLTGSAVTIAGYADRPAPASLLRLTADQAAGPGPRSGDALAYSGGSFTLYWNLGSRVSGFNHGDWINAPWDNYSADADLQAIRLEFEQQDGTPIGQREVAVANSATITKATDLGGFDTARIRVVPRRVSGSRLENSILVTSS